MNLFQLLRNDQRTLSGLLSRLQRDGERRPWIRRALLRRTRRTLEVHQHAENVLQHALREEDPFDDPPSGPDTEHRVAREMLADLERCEHGDERWCAKLERLDRTMRLCMEAERVTFARARRMLDPDDARALADALAESRLDEPWGCALRFSRRLAIERE